MKQGKEGALQLDGVLGKGAWGTVYEGNINVV